MRVISVDDVVSVAVAHKAAAFIMEERVGLTPTPYLYRVTTATREYVVHFKNGVGECSCPAGEHEKLCAHLIAVTAYCGWYPGKPAPVSEGVVKEGVWV